MNKLLSTILLVAFMSIAAHSQTSSLSGRTAHNLFPIEGYFLTPLPGTAIRLTGPVNTVAVSDKDGFYRIDGLPAGTYTVTVELANIDFVPAVQELIITGDTHWDFDSSLTVVNKSKLDTPEFFVREMYLRFLEREPENQGLNFWTNRLNAAHTQVAKAQARKALMCSFLTSAEFQLKFGVVTHSNQECN